MQTYKAPWGKTLIAISVLVTLLCVSAALLPLILPASPLRLLLWLPVLMIPACALFMIRGYSITPDAILIHRPFRDTRLPLAGLESATSKPNAMRGSIRTFGNGGFYSITGWYWGKSLRSYRAFVTDLNKTVILRYKDRTVIVSPDNPDGFVSELADHVSS